jgi:hypothetical protein
MDDLLLSECFNHSADVNPEIMDQSTIRRIIELQYKNIKPIIKLELFVYLCFFLMPYAYNVYVIDSGHDQNIVINYWIIHLNYMMAMST